MFLLVTVVSVVLGVAYAGLVDRRFGLRDRRRWIALVPFWVLAVAVALALHRVNQEGLLPQAIQSFAVGSLGETLVDGVRALRRRRVEASTRTA
ncbi:hypothetical protein [Cellulomonas soli]|uniref:Uncharacterized protein n=1 Tax=Cellulomonas soli TaxID=931535 RepID=A0A512PDT9_9CELL|nr:hypothetical protein [Cellulomonas soli]NYI59133.1 ABC-type Fe3+ transport system permease subunit [Cellulomonas soli]GEP69375.1 hypothetical protein CSO01_20900 [Cellulomonas soli]